MAECSHLPSLAALSPPSLHHAVNKEQCTQCFDDDGSELGIDVCLHCFNGGCPRKHAPIHVKRKSHPFTLNIRRVLRPVAERGEPPQKITKLAIAEENERDKYDFITTIKCWHCDQDKGASVVADHPQIKALVDGVMNSMEFSRQSEVKAWEEEIEACEHTLTLEQSPLPSVDLGGCTNCNLKENLWLCLACGSIGCGRQQFGGVGGNGHALQHFEQTGHGVSVKLGTITPEGSADIYCYTCNDARIDFDLAKHLSTFGINVHSQKKTEKSMTELQIEHNLKYDFSLTANDGKALEPVFGPGLTGLSNLGNSCYMASTLQVLFSLPSFQSRYSSEEHALTCGAPLPADCIECQMRKVADGLLSGRYSHPSSHKHQPTQESGAVAFQDGLKPFGFKALIGKGHAEFGTMRQQDSEEFLGHLITVLRRDLHKNQDSANDATKVFSYAMEQRVQCSSCAAVKYGIDETDVVGIPVPAHKVGDEDGKPVYEGVEFTQCLEAILELERVDGWRCTACGSTQGALKQAKFSTLPSVMVIHAKKFQLVNWVPTKLDVPLHLPPSFTVEFSSGHMGRGLQPGEKELPEEATNTAGPQFDAAVMSQLEAMGFPTVRCQKALLATGGSSADTAMEWLFAHMDDPDIDEPISTGGTGKQRVEVSDEQASLLADMGFTKAQATKALRETSGNAERAVEWLFNHPDDTGEDIVAASISAEQPPATIKSPPGSTEVPAKYKLKAFISHKGPSVHSGHYVAHIRALGDEWVLFNDEKVVKADKESVDELVKLAYVYIFERV